MIHRGTSHVLRDDLEIMKKLRKPVTVQLLKQLQWFYEARSTRIMWGDIIDTEALNRIELQEFLEMVKLLEKWMTPPLTLNFGTHKVGVDPVKAARRKARRERKKNANLT